MSEPYRIPGDALQLLEYRVDDLERKVAWLEDVVPVAEPTVAGRKSEPSGEAHENGLEPLTATSELKSLRIERDALQLRCQELEKALEKIVNSDMAMREEDEGRASPELEAARAALKGGEE